MHSFYSEDLKKTFWVGFGNGRANYFEIPVNFLKLLDTNIINFDLAVDIYLLNLGTPDTDSIGYTLFGLEDDNGTNAIEVKYFLEPFNFTPPGLYTIKIQVFFYGTTLFQTNVQITHGKINHKLLLRLSLVKVTQTNLKLVLDYLILEGLIGQTVDWDITIDLIQKLKFI